MCGRYTTEIETDEWELFRMLERAETNTPTVHPFSKQHLYDDKNESLYGFAAKREVFPSEPAAALMISPDGDIDAYRFRWGYPTEISGKKRLLINARSETAAEKTLFAESLACRRCVIPTAGFFEWQHRNGHVDPYLKYRFNLIGTGIVYLAGLYRPIRDIPQYQEFVILTRQANASMSPIHDRMPVVLRAEHVGEYLQNSKSAVRLLEETPPVLLKRLVS